MRCGREGTLVKVCERAAESPPGDPGTGVKVLALRSNEVELGPRMICGRAGNPGEMWESKEPQLRCGRPGDPG